MNGYLGGLERADHSQHRVDEVGGWGGQSTEGDRDETWGAAELDDRGPGRPGEEVWAMLKEPQ